MQLRLSQELTVSHTLRHSMTTTQASSLKYHASATQKMPTPQEPRSTATVPTMSRKASQSCGMRTLTYQSRATRQILQDSSTLLQEPTRRKDLKQARSISQLHQAAVREEHFTRTTWLQVLQAMV